MIMRAERSTSSGTAGPKDGEIVIVEIDGVEYEFRRQTDAELAARTPEERARAAEEAGDAMFRWYGRCYCTLPSKCSHCPPGGWKWGTERQDWWEWSP